MTEAQFWEKAINDVKRLIDCIAAHEYEKLHTIAAINPLRQGEGKTQEECMAEFTEWLDGQLAMWTEDYETEFVVDPFEIQHFDLLHFEGSCASAVYLPQSHGEPLDFWFELYFSIDENETITVEFDINV